MIIYKTTNLINGKFYVGMDSNNNPNYLGSGIALKRAIKKYGKESFVKEILEECSSIDELGEREIYWIKKLNAIKKGYNMAEGGRGGYLGKIIEEKRRKALIGHLVSEETKEKISNANKGKSRWPNGRKFSIDHIKKIKKNHADVSGENNSMYGKNHSEETKEKMKIKASGRYTEEWFIEKYGKEEGMLKREQFIIQCKEAAKKANIKRWGKQHG